MYTEDDNSQIKLIDEKLIPSQSGSSVSNYRMNYAKKPVLQLSSLNGSKFS